jgi:hypothetical protein
MNPLRLVTDAEANSDSGPTRPADRLPFPTAAVHVMNRERIGRLTTRIESENDPLKALEAQINKTLDRAQEQINQLREDVENYKFPTPEATDHNPPPRAA